MRVRIAARNVSIALRAPQETSIQNIFKAVVTKMSDATGDLVVVHMDIGCPLIARITRRAVRQLDLSPGKQVFAAVKSVAVSRGHLNAEIQTTEA